MNSLCNDQLHSKPCSALPHWNCASTALEIYINKCVILHTFPCCTAMCKGAWRRDYPHNPMERHWPQGTNMELLLASKTMAGSRLNTGFATREMAAPSSQGSCRIDVCVTPLSKCLPQWQQIFDKILNHARGAILPPWHSSSPQSIVYINKSSPRFDLPRITSLTLSFLLCLMRTKTPPTDLSLENLDLSRTVSLIAECKWEIVTCFWSACFLQWRAWSVPATLTFRKHTIFKLHCSEHSNWAKQT